MMKERDNDSAGKVIVNLTYEIYLKGREEPINQLVTFEIDPAHLDEGQELDDFMQIAVKHALQTIDTVGEHRLIYSDERFNKGIYLTEHIQAITILAPDEAEFVRSLENR